jgi:hypothetical protein
LKEVTCGQVLLKLTDDQQVHPLPLASPHLAPPTLLACLLACTPLLQDEALEVYNSLLELQAGRYPGETSRLAVARGECFKLVGDVYVAKRQFNR